MIIAVDGPAASGKGTLAKRLAAHYGLAYLDTGRTYRAVAVDLIARARPLDDEAAALEAVGRLDLAALDDPRLVTPEAGEGASRVAVMAGLREVLVGLQRAFARAAVAAGGAVLDGRDIGTAVLPDADIKLFVTASVEERARRRALELFGTDDGSEYEDVVAALRARDARDEGRAASPLRPAADAHLIDTTALDAEATFSAAVRLVDKARST